MQFSHKFGPLWCLKMSKLGRRRILTKVGLWQLSSVFLPASAEGLRLWWVGKLCTCIETSHTSLCACWKFNFLKILNWPNFDIFGDERGRWLWTLSRPVSWTTAQNWQEMKRQQRTRQQKQSSLSRIASGVFAMVDEAVSPYTIIWYWMEDAK